MTEEQARAYFESAMKNGSLVAGTNYMVDRDETIWDCVVWAGGGIWFIKGHPRQNTEEYAKLRRYVAVQPRTVFQKRNIK